MRPNRDAVIVATTLDVTACGTGPECLPPTSTPPEQAASTRASATASVGASDGPCGQLVAIRDGPVTPCAFGRLHGTMTYAT